MCHRLYFQHLWKQGQNCRHNSLSNNNSILFVWNWLKVKREFEAFILFTWQFGKLSWFITSFFNVCFTSFFVFRIAVLPHSPRVVYYHLLLRRETRFPGVAPFSFRIGIWDLFVHRGQKSYTPTAFRKLWTTPGVR